MSWARIEAMMLRNVHMRRLWIFSLSVALIAGGMTSGALELRAETAQTTRAQCVKMALKKAKLEKGGVRKILAMRPSAVRLQLGNPGIERVRSYIALREKVLFHCPADVLNLTASSLRGQQKFIPPLPQKRPRRFGRASPGGVRFKFPAPPG
jgi:hypothetical protein